MRRCAACFLCFLVLAVLPPAALCQTLTVTSPLPKIDFDPWKPVPSDESTIEYQETFPSAIQGPYPENNVVPIRVLLPAEVTGPVPAVVILHYWGATDLQVENELARELNDHGVGAVIMTLPYHLARTPKGSRSGRLAVVADPALLLQTMTQAVLDVRRTVDFLETRSEFDHSKFGIAGISLGAIMASVAFGVDDRLKFGAFMLGGADLAHIIWHSSRVGPVREDLRRQGITEAKLREYLEPVDAIPYLHSRHGEDSLVIGGKYDTVVPRSDTQKLVDALPGCQVVWLDTGHYGGVFVEKRLLRTAAEYFGKRFNNQKYTAPTHVYAPTLRIGLVANTASGLQLGAGVDLFKPSPKVPFLSTIIVTPKGLNLFAGFMLGQGLAIGGFATPQRMSVGAWWSIVL
jgi:dienelactone hydrolase